MKKYQSLTFKTTIWMSLVALAPLLLLAVYTDYQLRKELKVSQLHNLKVAYRQTIGRIDEAVKTQKNILESTVQIPLIARELKKTDKNTKTIAIDKLIEGHINRIVIKHSYYDFFIISKEGNIVYSYKKESDLGENLLHGSIKDTSLADVFREVSNQLETAIGDIAYYEPSKKDAAFAVTPVILENQLLGFIAVQLDREFIFELAKSENGLGVSGEIVAGSLKANGQIIATVPLKYDKDAFGNKRVLNQKAYATGMAEAVEGKSGSGSIIDYRGVKTLAAWGYEPNMRWGIVVKTDEAEVFSSIDKELKTLIVILLVVVALIIAIAISVSNSITKPIRLLVESMERFKLDFHHRANIKENNEIGFLASEFNSMADDIGFKIEILNLQAEKIKEHTVFLEDRVNERTAELLRAKKEVERYVSIVDRFVITSSTDINGDITNVSQAFCFISGYLPHELIGKNHRILKDPQMPKELFEDLWNTITAGNDWHGEMRNISKDGKYYWVYAHISPMYDESGAIVGYMAVREDITDKKIVEEIAITDQLTKLYNRRHIEKILLQQKDIFERYATPFCIIMLDIDKFKSINDVYGHQAGDYVLKNISEILKTHARAADIVGRWGGEEFLVVLPQTTFEQALIAAEHLRAVIEEFEFDIVGNKTASFGVALYGNSLDETIKKADDALYRAKNSGRNRVEG